VISLSRRRVRVRGAVRVHLPKVGMRHDRADQGISYRCGQSWTKRAVGIHVREKPALAIARCRWRNRRLRFRGQVEYSAEGYTDRLLGCIYTGFCVRSPGESTMSRGGIVAINCNFVLSTRAKPSFLYARSELRCAIKKCISVPQFGRRVPGVCLAYAGSFGDFSDCKAGK
jgi:hypothetical protein